MRLSLDNGNGACCDKCGKLITGRDIIKLKFLQLDKDPHKASTGVYKTINGRDLCKDCYNYILQQI